MESYEQLVVGLTAASGAGKSFMARAIEQAWPGVFRQPIVATTRSPRSNQLEPNRAFLTDDEFEQEVANGSVVLPHKPFSGSDSPKYGFVLDTIQTKVPLLTEVHATQLRPFRELLAHKVLVLVGLEVSPVELSANIECRQSGRTDGYTPNARLADSTSELLLIQEAHGAGVVDLLVGYDPEKRAASETLVIEYVQAYLDTESAEVSE